MHSPRQVAYSDVTVALAADGRVQVTGIQCPFAARKVVVRVRGQIERTAASAAASACILTDFSLCNGRTIAAAPGRASFVTQFDFPPTDDPFVHEFDRPVSIGATQSLTVDIRGAADGATTGFLALSFEFHA